MTFERKVSFSSFLKKSECFVKQKLVPARANPRYIVLQIQQKTVVTQTETMLSVWDIDQSDQPVRPALYTIFIFQNSN